MFVGHSLLDQDPATQINADPDPQPCIKVLGIFDRIRILAEKNTY